MNIKSKTNSLTNKMQPLQTEKLHLNFYEQLVNNKLKEIKKDFGIFFTPEWVVDLMVNMIEVKGTQLKILEPACGLAQFLLGMKRKRDALFYSSTLYGVEINERIIEILRQIELYNSIKIIHHDYLLWDTNKKFDIIIGNPPYGIPSHTSHYAIKIDIKTRRLYKKIFRTWYGKYNVYGAFIEKSITLLKNGGQLIFIVPATFLILDEFKYLRLFLSQNGKTSIIYLGPDVFKPEAQVTTVILNFIKSPKYNELLTLYEYDFSTKRIIKNYTKQWNGELISFETHSTQYLEKKCSHRLGNIYDIHISPRSPEIKNNRHVFISTNEVKNAVPILNGKNLKPGRIIYMNRSNYWIKKEKALTLREYFKKPRIVVAHTKGGKVVAAYDKKCYPWMGDVYHLIKKTSLLEEQFDMSEEEVVKYLNSIILQRYMKEKYREITPHTTATQLKLLPVPNKREWESIKKGVFYE